MPSAGKSAPGFLFVRLLCIDIYDGCIVPAGAQVVAIRDCVRQTVLDDVQLIRAIQAGMDLTGNGAVELNPNRIYYAGQSFGTWVGSVLSAIEPAIQSAVLNSCGGSVMEIGEWSPV